MQGWVGIASMMDGWGATCFLRMLLLLFVFDF